MRKILNLNFLTSFRREQAGNVSMAFAVSLLAVGAIVGAAVDYSVLSSQSQKLQDALDNSTLYASVIQETGTFDTDARVHFLDQVGDLNLADLTVSFELQDSNMIGIARAKSNLMFAGFLNKDSVNVAVQSVVTLGRPGGACILLLDPNRGSSLTLNSGADVDASDCEVHVHSTAHHAVSVNSGATMLAKRVCAAGGVNINSGGVIENVETPCTPDADPFAGKIAVPDDSSCDFNGTNYNGGNVHLVPGVYCGWTGFQNNGINVNLAPGLYVIKNGGWNFNAGNVTGDGVTIYFSNNATINFNGNINMNLKAPSSGTYAGILMAEVASNSKSPMNLNDSNGYNFEGVLYLPNRNLTLNSGANVRSDEMTIVANNLMINDVMLANKAVSGGGSSDEIYISE